MSKTNRNYSEEFKRQIVALRESGRRTVDLSREYGVSKHSINVWAKQYANSGKFGVVENLSDGEKELRILRKENKQLRMENDI